VLHPRVNACLVLLLSGWLCGTCPAAITPWWQPVPITATTDASGANLEGFQCWDLMADVSVGDNFTSMRIFSDPGGTIFHHAQGQPAPNFGAPTAAMIAHYPALAFDSFLRGPRDHGMTVVGSTDGTNDLPPPGVFDADRLAIAAGFLLTVVHERQLHLVRLTFDGPIPQVTGSVYTVQGYDQGVAIPPIPEPACASLIACAALLLIAPRRRCS
jgi:hypothetical protein